MENILYNDVVKFHGHSCAGLAIGFRAANIAIMSGFSKSEDEELVAIVENNSCSVDAIQYILSCTFGKGNLIFKDFGKQAFTIIKRKNGEAIRICLKPISRDKLSKDEFFNLIMKSPEDKIFYIKKFKISESEIPKRAVIYNSAVCDICKEPVMETKIKVINGMKYCISCFKKKEDKNE